MQKHSHYFKDVSGLQTIDVYRVLALFNVTDPCLQHAIKKLLVAGGRGGGKDISQDIQEAVDSLARWQEMKREDAATPAPEDELLQRFRATALPDATFLMDSVDHAATAYAWFAEARRFMPEETAFVTISRHLVKALESKLGLCASEEDWDGIHLVGGTQQ